jgi:hypothetical protein
MKTDPICSNNDYAKCTYHILLVEQLALIKIHFDPTQIGITCLIASDDRINAHRLPSITQVHIFNVFHLGPRVPFGLSVLAATSMPFSSTSSYSPPSSSSSSSSPSSSSQSSSHTLQVPMKMECVAYTRRRGGGCVRPLALQMPPLMLAHHLSSLKTITLKLSLVHVKHGSVHPTNTTLGPLHRMGKQATAPSPGRRRAPKLNCTSKTYTLIQTDY